MQVTKTITLDLLETGSPVIIKAKQNDRNTRYIAAHLYVGRLDYQVPSGTEIAFRYKKPDGTAGFYDALPDNSPAITVSGNTVTVELVEQVLTAAGCVHCEINMYNATSEKLTTFTFEIAVEESVLTDAEIISSDYYNVLTAEIAKALQAVTDATEQAENAAQSAQEAADSASMSKDWAAGQPVTYSGTPVSIAYAGTNRIASITAYGETPQGGTTEAPVMLTGVDSVQVCGRNLLPHVEKNATMRGVTIVSEKDGYILDGTATGYISFDVSNITIPAGNYVLSAFSGSTEVGARIRIGANRSVLVYGKETKSFDYTGGTLKVEIVAKTPSSVLDNVFIAIQLNLGNTAMPYEPYQGSVTPLPIPRPLRRVGDVKDKCVTRQDYESAEKLVVTYNVGFVELDGTEAWQASSQTSGMFFITRDNISAAAAICSNFNFSKSATTEQGKFYIVSNQIRFLTSYETLESWKNYLAAQKAEGTPVQVAYQLAAPEVYATDPVDFDNAAGPLTVMTGVELEVRMTELIGSRSDVSNNTVAFTETAQDADIASGEKLSVLFGKIKKRFAVIASNLSNIYNKTESDGRYATAAQGEKADNALPKTGGTISGNLTVVQDLTVQRAFNGMRIKAGVKVITTTSTTNRAELFTSDQLNTLFGTSGVTYDSSNSVVVVANGDYEAQSKNITAGFVNSKWAIFSADGSNLLTGGLRVNYIAIKFA